MKKPRESAHSENVAKLKDGSPVYRVIMLHLCSWIDVFHLGYARYLRRLMSLQLSQEWRIKTII